MIDLILVYCLANAPDRCVEAHAGLDPDRSATSCMMQAQILGRTYVDAHPKYRLRGWRCEIDRPHQTPV